ncbi:MAG: fused MFS/spermidine synthase [Micrococcales bacterium]|nr:fused MFS/spermidine synthase [Micrococcales bacterium]
MATARDAHRWPDGPVAIDTGIAELVLDGGGVTLMVNGVPSSFVDLDDPTHLEFEYQQYMAALIGELPAGPLRVVHLGGGACGLALAILAARPGSRQVAVEVDARLVELVRTWFDLPRPPALRIRVADARSWLDGARPGVADVVVRDVFAHDEVPAELVTVEVARMVSRALVPGGLYLVNCVDRPPLNRSRAEAATLLTVFEHVAVVAESGVLRGRRNGNVVLAASDTPLDEAACSRALRQGVVPARVLVGGRARAFAGSAAVLTDP